MRIIVSWSNVVVCWACLLLCFEVTRCQLPPPSLITLQDRHWVIMDTDPVGTVVQRVSGLDSSDAEYGLEPIGNYSKPLPFRIDARTGYVYINDTLKDRVGENIFLYVTGSGLSVKSEVWAQIVNSSAPSRRGSSFAARPPQVPLQMFSVGPGFPYKAHPPLPPSLQPAPPPQLFPTTKQHTTYSENTTASSPQLVPSSLPPQQTSEKSKIKTYTTANGTSSATIKTTDYSKYNVSGRDQSTGNDSDIISLTTVSTIQLHSPVYNSTSIKKENNINIPNHQTEKNNLLTAIVPIVSVCLVFVVLGVVAILFRKKICFGVIGKTGKEYDMEKEPSGGIVLREDPSVTMQQWRGPRAYSNRYEPWEREQQEAENDIPVKSDHWEFPRHRLKVFNILGEGAFGQVWRCEATDIDGKQGVTVVAVKTLKENASEKERADLMSELQVMKMLEPHPNVIRLLGCCTDKEPLFVIMEYVSKGKLQSYLRSSRAERYYGNMHGKSKTLTSRDLTSFAYQVARGMDYLSSKGIIHRDLAARNILISEDHTCKVADFGFARDVITSHVYERKSEGLLPIRWMAPESLYDNLFSVKSDVWSFGILIWEVVTLGSTPYPGLSAAEVMRKVRDGHRLDKPEHCRRELYNIMYYCWDHEPKKRPSFSELVELLEKLLLTETDYIELERFPDHSYYNMLSLSGEKL